VKYTSCIVVNSKLPKPSYQADYVIDESYH